MSSGFRLRILAGNSATKLIGISVSVLQGGRFFPKDGHLDFNPKIYETFGLGTFRKIVRHELAHYHLYYQGKGYRHGDRDFKDLLKQVDGLRYAPALSNSQSFLVYECLSCGALIRRRRRVNLQKYRCGRCMGKLSLSED